MSKSEELARQLMNIVAEIKIGISNSREVSLAITKIEEAVHWLGSHSVKHEPQIQAPAEERAQ